MAGGRHCRHCSKQIGERSKTGLCNPCFNRDRNADPEFMAARKAAIQRKFQDPAHREKMRKAMLRTVAKMNEDPAYRARLVERGKHLAATALRSPQSLAKIASLRAENGRKRSETVMAWCPPKYRDEYRFLTVSKRMKAADARQLILDKMAAEMTPFERAMDRIRQGAGIVTVRPIRKADHPFTLGGVSSL